MNWVSLNFEIHVQKDVYICFRTLFIERIFERLFTTLRTLSLESSLFSTIFHVNIRMVFRRTAGIIVLIKTINLSKIPQTSYEKSFHSKFL